MSSNSLRAALAAPFALLALTVSPGSAAAPSSFAVGGVPALEPGAVALGAVPATAPLSLDVVLAPRDPAGLAATAAAVSTPSSPDFHRYLTVAQFAARFGATPDDVAAVSAVLRADGLVPGPLAPDGLSLSVTGDAAQASRAFGVSLRRYGEPTGDVFANTSAPRLPAALHGLVSDVLGLDDVPAAAPVGLTAPGATAAAQQALPSAAGAGQAPSPCAQAGSRSGRAGPYTIDQIAGAYGLGGLYAARDFGAGVTVALYELEPYAAGDIAQFQSCFGTQATVSNVEVDGGPGTPRGGDPGLESALDIENVIGLAPQATIDVYQGPSDGSGPYATLQAIVDQNTAQVISDSWGLCELDLESEQSLLGAENTLLEQAATQGQTVLVASGDHGSQGCVGSSPNVGALSVDDPSSQPFATAVGGTTLSSLGSPGSPRSETAWNDGGGAGGGGVSAIWPMPSYQSGASVPGVVAGNPFASGAPCGNASGDCREVPDVSADASPSTGYIVYYGSAGQPGWYDVGGTSAGAPLWAGLTALADASGAGSCSPATPLGFLNPRLYAIAGGPNAAHAFDDITTGSNDPTGGGDYPASAGYDLATGLGTPIATDGAAPGLVAQLCDAPASATSPAPDVAAVSPADAAPGATVTITGSGFAAGATVTFGAAQASAVAVSGPAQLTATVPAGAGVVDVTVTTAAGASAVTAADEFTYAPTASITAPAAGATYTQGQIVAAAYACGASTAGGACTGPVPSGALLDTSQPGAHTFTVMAVDAHGISTAATASYTVVAAPVATVAARSHAMVRNTLAKRARRHHHAARQRARLHARARHRRRSR